MMHQCSGSPRSVPGSALIPGTSGFPWGRSSPAERDGSASWDPRCFAQHVNNAARAHDHRLLNQGSRKTADSWLFELRVNECVKNPAYEYLASLDPQLLCFLPVLEANNDMFVCTLHCMDF